MIDSLNYRKVGSIVLIPCEQIFPNSVFSRKDINISESDSLVESVKKFGIIFPLIIRKNNNRYEIVSGERRLRAAIIAGLVSVPCIIMSADDKQCAEFILTENLQRTDLNYYEKIELYEYLLSDIKYNSESNYNNFNDFTGLDEEIRLKILLNRIDDKYIKYIFKYKNKEIQLNIINYIIKYTPDVNEIEDYIDTFISSAKHKFIKLKDFKILTNTLNHAVDTMQKSGIKVAVEQFDSDDCYEYIVRIPKKTISPVFTENVG